MEPKSPPKAEVDVVRGHICAKSRELLVSKSTGVTSGWILNYAITVSVGVAVASIGLEKVGESDASSEMSKVGAPQKAKTIVLSLVTLLVTLIVFSLILVLAALCSRAVMSASFMPGRMKKTYAAGLGFIPAWQWKGVISAILMIAMADIGEEKSDLVLTCVVIAIAVITACVQVFLEHWASDAEPASLTYQIVSQLKTSLGLGLGFALNVLVYALAGKHMEVIVPQVIYVFLVTTTVALVQFFAKPKLAEMKAAGSVNDLVIRTLNFLLVATNFVVGWAWKGVLDVGFKDWRGVGVGSQLAVSMMVSSVLILLVVGLTLLSGYAAGPVSSLEELCMTASAMNVGWTWADFAMECLRVFKESEHSDGEEFQIGHLWLFAMLVVAVASVGALVMDFGIRKAEHSEEETVLVK